MPYREERWDESTDALRRYPQPDYAKSGAVATLGLEGESPVGWLVWQGEALAWFTREAPERGWGYGLRLLVEETMQNALRVGEPAKSAWRSILGKCPSLDTRTQVELVGFVADLRREWGLDCAE